MIYRGLPEKVLRKYRIELMELQERCINTYLIQRSVSLKNRRKFINLYHTYVSEKNILDYYNIPCWLLIQSMIKDTVSLLFRYINPNKSKKRKKKKV